MAVRATEEIAKAKRIRWLGIEAATPLGVGAFFFGRGEIDGSC